MIGEDSVKKELLEEPLVSIIIPVYNGSNYLREAIDSALNQTYTDIEVLVINDGSIDEGKTREIALSYGDKIRYFEKKNGGVSTALNYGIDRMEGEYFSWLSHDDRYKPNKILSQIEYLNQLEDKTTIIYGGYDLINEDGKMYYRVNPGEKWSEEQLNKPLFPVFKGLINGCSPLIHKSHFERVGKFDIHLKVSQDIDLWFRMFREAKLYYQSEINLETRIHEKRDSNKFDAKVEINQGWIRRMHRVTLEEMRETMGSPKLFYEGIQEAIGYLPNYKEAYEEAKRLATVYTPVVEEKPLVSVIIPFYNRVKMVEECVASVVSQTYKNLEILIIDDGSTEDMEILNSLMEADKRIRLIHEEHAGSSVARNTGIKEAKGTYIAFLDSDDLFASDKIEKQLKFMIEKEYVFSHTSYQNINIKEDYKTNVNSAEMKGIVFPQIMNLCRIAASTVMIKKEALGKMQFVPGMTVSEDICLWIDLANCYELGSLDEYLTIVRVSGNTTFFNKEKVKRGNLNVLNHIFENPEYLREEQDVGVLVSNFALLFF